MSNNTDQLSKSQIDSIHKLKQFMLDPDRKIFGLYGYAGTGKTFIILKFLFDLINAKFITSFVFTAFTNKAVIVGESKANEFIKNIIENKFNTQSKTLDENITTLSDKGIIIEFMTTHKLLGYKDDYEINGKKIFTSSFKDFKKLNKYNVIIIDECSMMPNFIVQNVYNLVKDTQLKTKIILVGDPAQLPPVNEISSSIFRTIDGKNCSIMTDIVRNSTTNIIKFCNHFRKWITKDIELSFNKYVCDKLYIDEQHEGQKKINTEWFHKYITNISKHINNSNIILTWTNKQTTEYNNEIRKYLFKDNGTGILKKFMVGDILMMNDFYNYQDTILYTSEQIKVIGACETTYEVTKINPNVPKKIIGLRIKVSDQLKTLLGRYEETETNNVMQNLYFNMVKNINEMNRKFDIWNLKIEKLKTGDKISRIKEEITTFTEIIDDCVETIMVINDQKKLDDTKQNITNLIMKIRELLHKENKDKSKIIDDLIIKLLWRLCANKFVKPFANVSYGFAITTHKSQGSTYKNIYVDASDILLNQRTEEAKRCLYTALTRASGKIYMLV